MQSLFDPAILFFVFGILAGALKSNLEIPPQISRFLALYLLMALHVLFAATNYVLAKAAARQPGFAAPSGPSFDTQLGLPS